MKRKIAAIFAADIAGYSRLVAEDEEETLRRLASYRAVTDDFIAKGSGRIFNTAGDAVFAEFPSAVDAVRCAIDIQESLRTRNRAYPPSRQMHFRIGITIGDVVERGGDLLGDGVNIAARLEGLAEPGSICVSHSVYEQVSNKVSVRFADIGKQQVKNIPTPVHAYAVNMHASGNEILTPRPKKSGGKFVFVLAATIALICVAGLGGATYTYLTTLTANNKVTVKNPTPPVASQVTVPKAPVQQPTVEPMPPAVPTEPAQGISPAVGPISPALKLNDPAKIDCTARTTGARMFATEPPRGAGALGFGEKAYVNDGQCPAGYIKQITGGGHGTGRRVQCVAC